MENSYNNNRNEIEKNSKDDFYNRFQSLAEEARAYGIDTLIIMEEIDRLKDESSSALIRRMPFTQCIGLLETYKNTLLNDAGQ